MLIISGTALSPMTWKAKFAVTHCRRLCPAGIPASPLGHRPATRIFSGRDLCNSSRTTCVLICPQIRNNLRIIYDSLFIPGPERFPFTRTRNICTWCILYHVKIQKDHWKNIRTRPEIIYTGSEILMPDSKLSGSPEYLRIYSYSSVRIPNYLLNCMWQIQLWSGSK